MIRIFLLSIMGLCIAVSSWAQSGEVINLMPDQTKVEIKTMAPEFLGLESAIHQLTVDAVQTEVGQFINLGFEGMSKSENIGRPDLPVITRLVEIPFGANVQVNILSYDEEVINLNDLGYTSKIAPAQPSYSKSTDPSTIHYIYDAAFYGTDQYNNDQLVEFEVSGVMRGVRFGVVKICPFHYNPVENTLIVYNNLEFELIYNDADFVTTDLMKEKYYSPDFAMAMGQFINYQAPATKDTYTQYPIKYVIVANRAFQATLQPFITWKRKSGYNVIEAYTDVVGTTNTAIKTYLEGLYDAGTSGNPAPSYVLIIGDHSGTYSIPAFAGTSATHITDLYFGTYDGASDKIPDVYIGRISAESTTELQNALNKIIPYEMYTIPDGSYLNKCMLIAGVDATYAKSHGDGTIYYGINYYYNTAHGYSNIYAYYHTYTSGPYSVMSSANAAADASVRSRFTEGIGFANYTAHCNWDQWGDPNVMNSDIANFNNANEYPFMIGNCCLSFQFNQSDAFGEILLYSANEGAIGYIGCSNNSYWDEDMYWGVGKTTLAITQANVTAHTQANTGIGAYDGIWHEMPSQSFSNWFYTAGQMNLCGNLQVEASTSTRKVYYWEIYHVVGDPSLMPYNTEPETLTISYGGLSVGSNSLTVTTEPYTYVAISQNGVLWDAEWSGSGTSVTLSFTGIANTNAVDIVATKQDRAAHIATITPVSTEPPVANFSGTPTTIMEGQSVAFTDLSQYATSWSWNFGDTQTATTQNPSHTYTTAGTYTVILTVTNPNASDSETKVNYITVTPYVVVPVAAFTADVTSTCIGSVVFTNSSIDASSYLWDFGDGTTSTEANPTHVYTTSGTFTVSLTATNSYSSDTETKPSYITVSLPASPTTTGATNCGPATLSLSASGSGTLAWYDAATGGNLVTTGTSYSQNFAATTTYYVQNQVANWVTYNAGPTNNSIGAGGYFTNTNIHGLYFNAQQDFVLKSVYVYSSNTGNKLITLKNSAGTTIATKTVTITSTSGQRVTLDFTIPAGTGYQLLGPASPNLYRNTAGASYPYNLSGVLSIYGNTANDLAYYYYFYAWEVQVNEPCISARVPVTATINTVPTAVTITGGGTQCGGTMTLNATGGTGGTIYYQGTTSGGTSTTTPSASQTISTSGTYYFRAQSAGGCWGTEGSATVTINAVPGAVTVSGGGTQCGGTITLTATGGTGGTIYWQGTTSGGTSTTTASSSQTVSTSGTYYFRARNAAGCWGTEGSAIVTINPVPTAVTVSGGGTQCGGTMTLTATGGTGGTIYYQGTTSGGTSTATASSSQTVSTSGTYYFRARSAAGCWGTEGSATVTINAVPGVVTVSGGGTQCGGTITLTATGGTGGTIYWQNTTSGGTSTTIASSSQTVSSSGTYYFRARNASGCWGTEGSASVTINTVPTAVVVTGGGTQCGGTMTLTATGGTGGTIYWQETTSGGTSIATPSTSQTVSTSGTYYFRALSSGGCWGTEGSATVTINPAISVDMSMTEASTSTSFDGTATAIVDGGTAPFTYIWSNGLNNINPATGLNAGNYCVTVQDNLGCTASNCIDVTSLGQTYPPVADFSSLASSGCAPVSVEFTDNSSNNPTTWEWNFGDGSASTEQNPTHIYNVPGTYTVSLTATNADGSNTVEKIDFVVVYDIPGLSVEVVNASGETMADGSATLTIIGGAAPYTIYWSNGTSENSIANMLPGSYSVMVMDDNGCVATLPVVIGWEVFVSPVVTANMIVYPNPTDTYLIIESVGFSATEITVSDVLGKTIIKLAPSTNVTRIDVSKLNSGIYFVSSSNNDKKFVQKIIVK